MDERPGHPRAVVVAGQQKQRMGAGGNINDRLEGLVRELYDVAALPQVSRPMALGFKTDEIQRTITISEDGLLS